MSLSRRFRNFIRRHTGRKTEQEALYWTNKLSPIYVFFSWNALGLVIAAGIYKFQKAKIGEQKTSRGQDSLERALTWGNFTARMTQPKINKDKDNIQAIETES